MLVRTVDECPLAFAIYGPLGRFLWITSVKPFNDITEAMLGLKPDGLPSKVPREHTL